MSALDPHIKELDVINSPVGYRQQIPTVLYFCYGDQSIYNQTVFSILSLLHVQGGSPQSCRIVVYCDHPEKFTTFPVEIVSVDAETLNNWLDRSDYVHRRKTCVLIDALARFGGRVIFIDSDTYFRQSPEPLFAQVGPGRACFHICEGLIRSTGTAYDLTLAAQIDGGNYRLLSGRAVTVNQFTRMWNTGVAGIDAADRWRIDDALALSDAIWAGADPDGVHGRKIHHGEQFAMGFAFEECDLSEAARTVYHYWPLSMKTAFNNVLAELAPARLDDLSPANLSRLYRLRPRQTGIDGSQEYLKMCMRRTALVLGLQVRGVRRSVL